MEFQNVLKSDVDVCKAETGKSSSRLDEILSYDAYYRLVTTQSTTHSRARARLWWVPGSKRVVEGDEGLEAEEEGRTREQADIIIML